MVTNPVYYTPATEVPGMGLLGWNLTYRLPDPACGWMRQERPRPLSWWTPWAVCISEGGGTGKEGTLPSLQVQEPSTGEQVPPLLQLQTDEQLGP